MIVSDPLGHMQTETDSAARIVTISLNSMEGIAHEPEVIGGNTNPIVREFDDRSAGFLLCR